ncbi:50S ribosomal protein L18 [Buchnera aphidicola]|uniref:Large ribosomal subunit protein uL18 n=1 Tax=Buchnera aphidicola str. USDA (Myzus persicae) TaxID=1009856 RepID=W0NZJ9_BUCMP|nr:50S ribosomal protein L18 [Buchnera aphidicola]AHG59894.1 Rplr [Buchnera aphidicola str. USDA (Myzus persicae)]AHG60474.1 Rplr [Buchnera aphidicola str. W106 (Myzus persicae)]AHG61047.1 Rplr [Buchnera aphidicola str. G002 (Myzus persicae)]AHG61619.1 Rplr [Buchnera aphidicola str. F009 (Myzus persicae)]WAI02868.1 MAG: 50S ribosomal protein L18 [Buchnera aphidicola (Myzus persicae)]
MTLSKKNKIISRIRRSMKTRCKIKKLQAIRLVVHRTSRHIYAQIISSIEAKVLVFASTLEKNISANLKYTGNKTAAQMIGKIIAERALSKGIYNVSFDRSGFKYHGRIQVLAESAREVGLKF